MASAKAAPAIRTAPVAFCEGGVIAGETSDGTDDAIQKSIVSVYGN